MTSLRTCPNSEIVSEKVQANLSDRLRKRKHRYAACKEGEISKLLGMKLNKASRFIAFSGSGLSADSGVSTFVSSNGFYKRAKKKFRLPTGQTLFSYSFLQKNQVDAQAFFATIFDEVSRSQPGRSHQLLASIENNIVTHYTMNIDGLSSEILDHTKLVEIHGNVRVLICPECGFETEMSSVFSKRMKSKKGIRCKNCLAGLRSKIVLYNDEHSELITPESSFISRLRYDIEKADIVLWMGISFEQAASIDYFNRFSAIDKENRLLHLLVNPDPETEFNLVSGIIDRGSRLIHLKMDCASFLEELAKRLQS